jgi:hypothetical protein
VTSGGSIGKGGGASLMQRASPVLRPRHEPAGPAYARERTEEASVVTHHRRPPATIEEVLERQAPEGRTSIASQHEAVLDLQETVGNTAVSSMLGEAGVQRSPEAEPADNAPREETRGATLTIDGVADKEPLESVQLEVQPPKSRNAEKEEEPAQDVHIVLKSGKVASALQQAMLKGSIFPKAELRIGQVVIELNNVVVAGFQISAGGDGVVSITLNGVPPKK